MLWFIGSHLEKCMHFNGRASRPGCFWSCVVKDPLNRDDAQASFNTLAIKNKTNKKKKQKKKQKEMEIFETEVTFEMIQG